MSAEQDKIRSIAGRIAGRLAGGEAAHGEPRANSAGGAAAGGDDELTQLRATLRELQRRLAHVESHVAHGDDCGPQAEAGARRTTAAPPQAGAEPRQQSAPRQQQFMSSTYVPAAHPSQEHFGIDDAVSELVDFFEREKVCGVEPGGKPCDQCGMCSSRGF